jgi:hypothetical protein
MGITRGPRIVKDGIVLHFDAASQRSYESGSSIWNNLSNVSSSISASANGNVLWDNKNNGRIIYDGIAGTWWECGIVPFNTGSYTKVVVFELYQEQDNNLLSGITGGHALWVTNNSTTVVRAGHAGSYSEILATIPDMTAGWNWVAQTFDSTNGFEIYHNRLFVTSSTSTIGITATPEGKLGQWNTATGNQLSGSIAIAMVYNKVLSADEMLQNYNAVRGRFGLGDTSYDTDTLAFITAVENGGDTLSYIEKLALDDLVSGLKTYNIWDKHDIIYPMLGGTTGSVKWNLKDPRDLDDAYRLEYFIEGTGSISASPDGLVMNPNGASQDNGGVAYTHYETTDFQTGGTDSDWDFNMSIYSNRDLSSTDNGALNASYFSNEDIGGIVQIFFYTNPNHYGAFPDRFRARVGTTEFDDDNTTFDATNDGTGMFTVTSAATQDTRVYHNSTEINGSPFTNSGARSALNPATDVRGMTIGGLHNSDAPPSTGTDFFGNHYTEGTWCFISIGKTDLTEADAANLNTIVTKFQTTLGR